MDDAIHATPPAVRIRPAARADLKAIGRLGALLVRIHHDLDPDRFIAATAQTEHGYGSGLATRMVWCSTAPGRMASRK